jgi:hypothetical protein
MCAFATGVRTEPISIEYILRRPLKPGGNSSRLLSSVEAMCYSRAKWLTARQNTRPTQRCTTPAPASTSVLCLMSSADFRSIRRLLEYYI